MSDVGNLFEGQVKTIMDKIKKGHFLDRNLIATDLVRASMIFESIDDQLTKFIVLLLGNKNNKPVSLICLHLEMYILHKIFPKLSLELSYPNHNPNNDTVTVRIEYLIVRGIVKFGDKLVLTDSGLEKYREYKETSTKEELEVTKDFKDLFNDLTLDELWALVYFSHPELKIEHNIYERITSKRKELAYSMYHKDKLTLSKTAQIADKYLGDVMNELALVNPK